MKEQVLTKLETCILDNFPWADQQEFDWQDNLFDKGILDSLGFLTIIAFMEEQFDMKVKDEDVVPENFSSINSMADYVINSISE